VPVQEFNRLTDDVGVLGAAQTSVGCNNDEFNFVVSSNGQQRVGLLGNSSRQTVQNSKHLPGIGTSRNNPILSFAQSCRRDELHGAGDLLDILGAADAAPDVTYIRHSLPGPI
jgi:hypothetical protein